MKIEDQVCNRDQAKRLAELSVHQNSLFWHVSHGFFGRTLKEIVHISQLSLRGEEPYVVKDHGSYQVDNVSSAFTVAELGVMLTRYSHTWRTAMDDNWAVANTFKINAGAFHLTDFRSEAQARAAMLINLLEQNIIEVEEVNQRLIGEASPVTQNHTS